MWKWIDINKWKILLVVAGILVGYFANVYANAQSEKRIIDALTAEIESIKNSKARLTAESQQRLIELNAQLNLLKGVS